jgi:long-chain acyl-CoA synthetase
MVVYVGNRSYATALVTLDPEAVQAWAHGEGLDVSDPVALTTSEPVRAHVHKAVEELNRSLNKWETIKQFRILPVDLSVEAGELTPSLKIKRKVIEVKYSEVIDEMYAGH